MCRRVRVVRANHGFQLAEGAIGGVGIGCDQGAGANAFVVQTEVFRVGARHNQLFVQRGKCAQAFGIFFQTASKALVGEVKQRQPTFFNRQICQLLPLLQRRVDTGWVMAAAMEQHHVTRLGFIQARQQAVEVEGMLFRIVVVIFAYFQARSAKDALVVRPAWVADPNALHVSVFCEEIRRYAQCACAAWGLSGARAFVTNDAVAFAEQQLLRAATKLRNTINTEIVFGGLILQQILLSFFNAGQHRRLAGLIFINTNPEIDFSRAFVGAKQIGQAQNWVGRGGCNVLKHDEVPLISSGEIRYQVNGRFTKCQPLETKSAKLFKSYDLPL